MSFRPLGPFFGRVLVLQAIFCVWLFTTLWFGEDWGWIITAVMVIWALDDEFG